MKRISLTAIALFFCLTSLRAQSPSAWQYLGPEGGDFRHIAASGDTLYAAANGGRLFRSVNGTSWQEMILSTYGTPSGLFATSGSVTLVYSYFPFWSDAIYYGIWFINSTNGGVSWSSSPVRYPQGIFPYPIVGIVPTRTNRSIIAGEQGIVSATTNYYSYYPFSIAASPPQILVTSSTMRCIAAQKSIILAGTSDSLLYRSNDGGMQWESRKQRFAPQKMVFVSDSTVIAISTNALFRSTDIGTSWQQIATLPTDMRFQGLAYAHNALYAATNLGIVRTKNLGQSWESAQQRLSVHNISSIISGDSAVFAFIRPPNQRGFLSPEPGDYYRLEQGRWTPFILPNNRSASFIGRTERTFWANTDSILWRSANGLEWLKAGILPNSAKRLSAITSQYDERELYFLTSVGLHRSNDDGNSWQRLDSSSPSWYSSSIAVADSVIWMSDCTISNSLDKGKTWIRFAIGSCVEEIVNHNGALYASGYKLSWYELYPYLYWMLPIAKINSIPGSIGWGNFSSNPVLIASRKGEFLQMDRFSGNVQYLTNNNQQQNLPTVPLNGTNTFLYGASVLSLSATNRTIYVGTSSGVFALNAVSTSVRNPVQTPSRLVSSVFPQPSSDAITIEIVLPRPTHLSLTLENMLGQQLETLFEGSLTEGKHHFIPNVNRLAQGVYLYKITSANGIQTGTIHIVR